MQGCDCGCGLHSLWLRSSDRSEFKAPGSGGNKRAWTLAGTGCAPEPKLRLCPTSNSQRMLPTPRFLSVPMQGAVTSSLLCSLYMASLETTHLLPLLPARACATAAARATGVGAGGGVGSGTGAAGAGAGPGLGAPARSAASVRVALAGPPPRRVVHAPLVRAWLQQRQQQLLQQQRQQQQQQERMAEGEPQEERQRPCAVAVTARAAGTSAATAARTAAAAGTGAATRAPGQGLGHLPSREAGRRGTLPGQHPIGTAAPPQAPAAAAAAAAATAAARRWPTSGGGGASTPPPTAHTHTSTTGNTAVGLTALAAMFSTPGSGSKGSGGGGSVPAVSGPLGDPGSGSKSGAGSGSGPPGRRSPQEQAAGGAAVCLGAHGAGGAQGAQVGCGPAVAVAAAAMAAAAGVAAAALAVPLQTGGAEGIALHGQERLLQQHCPQRQGLPALLDAAADGRGTAAGASAPPTHTPAPGEAAAAAPETAGHPITPGQPPALTFLDTPDTAPGAVGASAGRPDPLAPHPSATLGPGGMPAAAVAGAAGPAPPGGAPRAGPGATSMIPCTAPALLLTGPTAMGMGQGGPGVLHAAPQVGPGPGAGQGEQGSGSAGDGGRDGGQGNTDVGYRTAVRGAAGPVMLPRATHLHGAPDTGPNTGRASVVGSAPYGPHGHRRQHAGEGPGAGAAEWPDGTPLRPYRIPLSTQGSQPDPGSAGAGAGTHPGPAGGARGEGEAQEPHRRPQGPPGEHVGYSQAAAQGPGQGQGRLQGLQWTAQTPGFLQQQLHRQELAERLALHGGAPQNGGGSGSRGSGGGDGGSGSRVVGASADSLGDVVPASVVVGAVLETPLDALHRQSLGLLPLLPQLPDAQLGPGAPSSLPAPAPEDAPLEPHGRRQGNAPLSDEQHTAAAAAQTSPSGTQSPVASPLDTSQPLLQQQQGQQGLQGGQLQQPPPARSSGSSGAGSGPGSGASPACAAVTPGHTGPAAERVMPGDGGAGGSAGLGPRVGQGTAAGADVLKASRVGLGRIATGGQQPQQQQEQEQEHSPRQADGVAAGAGTCEEVPELQLSLHDGEGLAGGAVLAVGGGGSRRSAGGGRLHDRTGAEVAGTGAAEPAQPLLRRGAFHGVGAVGRVEGAVTPAAMGPGAEGGENAAQGGGNGAMQAAAGGGAGAAGAVMGGLSSWPLPEVIDLRDEEEEGEELSGDDGERGSRSEGCGDGACDQEERAAGQEQGQMRQQQQQQQQELVGAVAAGRPEGEEVWSEGHWDAGAGPGCELLLEGEALPSTEPQAEEGELQLQGQQELQQQQQQQQQLQGQVDLLSGLHPAVGLQVPHTQLFTQAITFTLALTPAPTLALPATAEEPRGPVGVLSTPAPPPVDTTVLLNQSVPDTVALPSLLLPPPHTTPPAQQPPQPSSRPAHPTRPPLPPPLPPLPTLLPHAHPPRPHTGAAAHSFPPHPAQPLLAHVNHLNHPLPSRVPRPQGHTDSQAAADCGAVAACEEEAHVHDSSTQLHIQPTQVLTMVVAGQEPGAGARESRVHGALADPGHLPGLAAEGAGCMQLDVHLHLPLLPTQRVVSPVWAAQGVTTEVERAGRQELPDSLPVHVPETFPPTQVVLPGAGHAAAAGLQGRGLGWQAFAQPAPTQSVVAAAAAAGAGGPEAAGRACVLSTFDAPPTQEMEVTAQPHRQEADVAYAATQRVDTVLPGPDQVSVVQQRPQQPHDYDRIGAAATQQLQSGADHIPPPGPCAARTSRPPWDLDGSVGPLRQTHGTALGTQPAAATAPMPDPSSDCRHATATPDGRTSGGDVGRTRGAGQQRYSSGGGGGGGGRSVGWAGGGAHSSVFSDEDVWRLARARGAGGTAEVARAGQGVSGGGGVAEVPHVEEHSAGLAAGPRGLGGEAGSARSAGAGSRADGRDDGGDGDAATPPGVRSPSAQEQPDGRDVVQAPAAAAAAATPAATQMRVEARAVDITVMAVDEAAAEDASAMGAAVEEHRQGAQPPHGAPVEVVRRRPLLAGLLGDDTSEDTAPHRGRRGLQGTAAGVEPDQGPPGAGGLVLSGPRRQGHGTQAGAVGVAEGGDGDAGGDPMDVEAGRLSSGIPAGGHQPRQPGPQPHEGHAGGQLEGGERGGGGPGGGEPPGDDPPGGGADNQQEQQQQPRRRRPRGGRRERWRRWYAQHKQRRQQQQNAAVQGGAVDVGVAPAAGGHGAVGGPPAGRQGRPRGRAQGRGAAAAVAHRKGGGAAGACAGPGGQEPRAAAAGGDAGPNGGGARRGGRGDGGAGGGGSTWGPAPKRRRVGASGWQPDAAPGWPCAEGAGTAACQGAAAAAPAPAGGGRAVDGDGGNQAGVAAARPVADSLLLRLIDDFLFVTTSR